MINQGLQWNTFAKVDRVSGGFGVDVFFAISGIIMWHTGLRNRQNPATFAWRRVSRIVPLYWIATGIELILRWVEGNPTTLAAIACSLLFIPQGINPVLGVGWTLNLEMLFYGLIVLALLVNRQIAPWLVIAALALAPVTHPIAKNFGVVGTFWTNPDLYLFALGILIGMAWDRWPQRLPAASVWGAVAALIVFLVADNVRGHHLPFPVHIVVGASIIAVATFARNIDPKGVMKHLHRLGDASYSLYLSHVLTLGFLKQAVIHLGAPIWTWFVIGFPLSLLVAFASYHTLERPLTAWLSGRPKSDVLPAVPDDEEADGAATGSAMAAAHRL